MGFGWARLLLPARSQVVILGAGADTRAWRLPLPADCTVWEVDTGTVEPLKVRPGAPCDPVCVCS